MSLEIGPLEGFALPAPASGVPSSSFNPLDYPSCLLLPRRLTDVNSWHSHIPFGMALVEMLRPRVLVELGVHKGDSYCAFCQAVDSLKLLTKCFGVDTWKGDDQAGRYDESVFRDLKQYHDEYYAGFSTLLRRTFDDALDCFADESIDLLHIDGLHTYDAVKHDFEAWLPKVSDRGVVLLHDINTHDGEFGVWQLWKELKDTYPAIDFSHGYGLGVVTVGEKRVEALECLRLDMTRSAVAGRFFFRLGDQLSTANARLRDFSRASAECSRLSVENSESVERARKFQEQSALLNYQNASLKTVLEEKSRVVLTLEEQIEELKAELQAQVQNLLAVQPKRTEQLVHQLRDLGAALKIAQTNSRSLERERDELTSQLVHAQSEAEQLRSQLSRAVADLRALQATRAVRFTGALAGAAKQIVHSTDIVIHGSMPIDGALDLPTPDCVVSGTVTVAGWAHSKSAVVTGIQVSLVEENVCLGTLPLGIDRPDVIRARPWQRDVRCGFAGSLNLAFASPGPATLLIRVEDDAGRNLDFRRRVLIKNSSLMLDEPKETPGQPQPNGVVEESVQDNYRHSLEALSLARLRNFLVTGRTLVLPKADYPIVSIVIPTFNRAHYTLAAIESILSVASSFPFELVIVDNGSTDETRQLLASLENAQIRLHDYNQGFIAACNEGAQLARAKYVCFLNSDTQLLPGSLSALIETLEGDQQCAAVGAKLVYPNGRLQEAGSIIWRDGSALGYGRGADPSAPEYCYVREVDFCSGACLLVRRDLFLSLGGFDDRYAPAYYEDADLCMSLRQLGFKVLYQPQATLIHHEYGSSGSARAVELQVRNQAKFVAKWERQLSQHQVPNVTHLFRARDRRGGTRVLVVDDRIPLSYFGSGFPRTLQLLYSLADLGYVVTYLPRDPSSETTLTPELQQRGIEVLHGVSDTLGRLRERAGLYDVIIVCRPHNAFLMKPIKELNPTAAVIYDAEAIYSLRDIRKEHVEGRDISEDNADARIHEELDLIRPADVTIAVSETEAQYISRFRPDCPVMLWEYPVSVAPSPGSFSDRSDLLFVGYLATPPNSDALRYFLSAILPSVRSRVRCRFVIVGAEAPADLPLLASSFGEDVTFTGFVEDLAPVYERARIFVAPHRFAAGTPLKVIDAMAHGVPCVISELLANQLGVTDEVEAFVARNEGDFADKTARLYTDQDLWTRLRENSLRFVERRFEPTKVKAQLSCIMEQAVSGRRAPARQ